MKQNELINGIRKKCGRVEYLPSIGWFFIYNKRHYIYINRNDDLIRFCIPHLIKAHDYKINLLLETINEINRSLKFIKVVKLNNGSISLNYDYMLRSDDTAAYVVSRIIGALDYASTYFLKKLNDYSY